MSGASYGPLLRHLLGGVAAREAGPAAVAGRGMQQGRPGAVVGWGGHSPGSRPPHWCLGPPPHGEPQMTEWLHFAAADGHVADAGDGELAGVAGAGVAAAAGVAEAAAAVAVVAAVADVAVVAAEEEVPLVVQQGV